MLAYRALIVTALDLETEAVLRHLTDVENVRHASLIYPHGRFDEGLGWEVAVVQTGPGNLGAGPAVEAALATFEPAAAIFAGVAGGFAEQGVDELDLIVPTEVDDYQAARAGSQLTPRPRQRQPSAYCLHAARTIARTGSWLDRLDPPPSPAPTVRLEPLASGDHVVKALDSPTYELIRSLYDRAVGVDMEASGFLTAANLHHGLQTLVIRGVSDLISDKDLDRDLRRQPEAANRASAFAFEVLATMPGDVLPTRPQEREVVAWPLGGAAAGAVRETVSENRLAGESEQSSARTETDARRTVVELADEVAQLIGLDRWHLSTENVFSSAAPAIRVEFDERLEATEAWLRARVPVPGADEVGAALANLASVVQDFREVFHRHAELDDSGSFYRTGQFYRQYQRPVLERERLAAEFAEHVALVRNLAAETTRALNLIAERVRAHHDPEYRIVAGAAGILAGPDQSFVVVTYTDEERDAPQPYPGLAHFPDAMETREGVFTPPTADEPWPEEIAERLEQAAAGEDLEAAHGLAFQLATLLAEGLAPGAEVVIKSGHERDFDVRIRAVTVRWLSGDGQHLVGEGRHLARAYLTARQEADEARERLVGRHPRNLVAEMVLPAGSRLIESLDDDEVRRFAREASRVTEALARS